MGLMVIRFDNNFVLSSTDEVLAQIETALKNARATKTAASTNNVASESR